MDTLLGPEGTGTVGVRGLWMAGPGPTSSELGGVVWWSRLFFENCTVDASISGGAAALLWGLWFRCVICVIVSCVQVFKGIRWMPWHQEPMKDVGACDMPRGVGNQTVIRGFPNGETWHPSWGVAAC